MLQDKVAIVTGGTRGIGFAVVKKFLDNGAKVVLFGTKEESVQNALIKLKQENSMYEVMGMHPDITNMHEVEKAFAEINSRLLYLAKLVINFLELGSSINNTS